MEEIIHIRLSKELHKGLKLLAVQEDKSMTALIRELIGQCLKEKRVS